MRSFLTCFEKGQKNQSMVGAAGIPHSRCQPELFKDGLKEDPSNHLLMHAISANVSGQIASVVAGGAIIKIVVIFLLICRNRMEVIMSQNIMYALEIMGKGMGSIFAVILLLTLIVMLMSKFAEIKNRNSSQDEA